MTHLARHVCRAALVAAAVRTLPATAGISPNASVAAPVPQLKPVTVDPRPPRCSCSIS
jgi:hypothetical protein